MEKSNTYATDSEAVVSRNRKGLTLIPVPSNNPEDPLNWSWWRKARVLFVVCLAAYAGNVAALAGQLAYPIQAETYHIESIKSSYSVSAALAGLAAGALFFCPLAHIFGRSAVTFWSLMGSLACAVWSASMTRQDDYVPFVISRMLSGVFGSVPSALGGGTIMDVFFLHQRGRALMVFGLCLQLGAVSGPTFGAFVLSSQSWPVCFWWTVALLGITAILVLLFSEETKFDREQGTPLATIPRDFLANRIATFCPGTKVTPRPTVRSFMKTVAAPFLIGASPAVVVVGLFAMFTFGWALLVSVLSPLFLQTPRAKGGYGFTPLQNGAFSFSEWTGEIVAQITGVVLNDAVPLWICTRFYRGVWKPELRLYVIWVPIFAMPIGLGLCGAALQYHLHYMVFAVGVFFTAFAALHSAPIATNYVADSFLGHGETCALVITFYRLAWGEAIPFFAEEWIAKVGVGWVFGTSAFLQLASALLVVILILKGETLRRWSISRSLAVSEQGAKLK